VAVLNCSQGCDFNEGRLPLQGELCSASLVAPNLAVTARHCVSGLADFADGSVDVSSSSSSGIACSTARFAAPANVESIAVVFGGNLGEASPFVRPLELIVQADDRVCGADVAALVLPTPTTGPKTIAPDLETSILSGDAFSAIGYGSPRAGLPAGRRIGRDDLRVACVGNACDVVGRDLAPSVAATEWLGTDGPCDGDSGGPAVDGAGKMIGILSRGAYAGCQAPIYARLDSIADWMSDTTRRAAAAGGYPVPAWALGSGSDAGARPIE
jgi:hypothetical protein